MLGSSLSVLIIGSNRYLSNQNHLQTSKKCLWVRGILLKDRCSWSQWKAKHFIISQQWRRLLARIRTTDSWKITVLRWIPRRRGALLIIQVPVGILRIVVTIATIVRARAGGIVRNAINRWWILWAAVERAGGVETRRKIEHVGSFKMALFLSPLGTAIFEPDLQEWFKKLFNVIFALSSRG